MKKLLTVALALAALTILAPQAGFAQVWNNQLGIYSDQIGTPASANFVATPFVAFDAYLVLNNPINDTYNGGAATARPVTAVGGFECKITMPASTNFILLGTTYPADAIDAGTKPTYAVGFASSVPVVNGAVVLATFSMMTTTSDQFDVFMDMARFPSIPGYMAIYDSEDPLDPLTPTHVSTGDFGVPVFSINGTAAVALENDTWGGVKSLYR